MSLGVGRQVNFGSRKAGLLTVGVTVYSKDGVVAQVRSTDGVAELVGGIYYKQFVFEDDFEGMLVWDTGEATPLYAIESFDYRVLAEPAVALGPAYPYKKVDEVWTEKEKKKLIKDTKVIKSVIKKIETSPAITESNTGQLKIIKESIELIREQIDKIEPSRVVQEGVNQINVGLETLATGLEALIEGQKVKDAIKEAEDYVETKIS